MLPILYRGYMAYDWLDLQIRAHHEFGRRMPVGDGKKAPTELMVCTDLQVEPVVCHVPTIENREHPALPRLASIALR